MHDWRPTRSPEKKLHMKIRVYCEATIGKERRAKGWGEKTWILMGTISAPCLPPVGSHFWFLDDVRVGADPASVTHNDTFQEIKKGVFEPEIHLEWEIEDYIPREASFEEGVTYFEKDVLPKLIERGWKLA